MRNKGYTLIELVAVVAIIGSLFSISLISLSSISSGQAKKCAGEIDALISRCKVGAMSREGDVYLKLYIAGGIVHGAYYENGTLVSDDELSRKALSVSYLTDNGMSYSLEDTPLSLSFVRDTGAFMVLNDVPGSIHAYSAEASCVRIDVSGGNRTISLMLVPPTGSHRTA
jgi:prepilin-type N-terminal cleavage/methylation domain-containing protein